MAKHKTVARQLLSRAFPFIEDAGWTEERDELLTQIIRELWPMAEYRTEIEAKPLDDWHEELGTCLWWRFPIREPPYVGTPNDKDWPEYHTHWTPIPLPKDPDVARPGTG